MQQTGAGFLARQERCSQLDSIRTQRQNSDYAARIRYATGGDHRHISDVCNLRDERECARQRIFRASEARTAVATCHKAPADAAIETGILKSSRLVRGCRGSNRDDVVSPTLLQA